MEDFPSYFKAVNICRILNWHEIRINGKFVRAYVINHFVFISIYFF